MTREPKGTWLWVPNVNPEPWTPGVTGQVNTKNGPKKTVIKEQKLVAYQNALAGEFQRLYGKRYLRAQRTPVWVRFVFWRSTAGGGQPADATNLQKATEDALQGLIFPNDRYVWRVESSIQQQGPLVKQPAVLIWIADKYEAVDGFPRLPQAGVSKSEDEVRRSKLNIKDIF